LTIWFARQRQDDGLGLAEVVARSFDGVEREFHAGMEPPRVGDQDLHE
jgi:hypothetical protein